jgi:hypothetical protein
MSCLLIELIMPSIIFSLNLYISLLGLILIVII